MVSVFMSKETVSLEKILAAWQGGLIVSCQAAHGAPLAKPVHIAALAETAAQNGAVGVRIEGTANIEAVRETVQIPVLGIEKIICHGSEVYITPTYDSLARIARSGAHIVALDGTNRLRPNNETFASIVAHAQVEYALPVMADIATYKEGVNAAEECGVEIVGTTLSGYTAETHGTDEPDFDLIERLAERVRVPVIAEGRLRSVEDVRRAFDCGAFAVVVGAAITGIDWLVRHYVSATPGASENNFHD